MKRMRTISFLADGKFTPVVGGSYPEGDKIEFCKHTLEVVADETYSCKECFFNEPWFDCARIKCNRSERLNGKGVIFREVKP